MPPSKLPLTLPPQISPHIREFFEKLLIIAKDYRTQQLVDYLCDLRMEMRWVLNELEELDFDAAGFLELLDEDDNEEDDGDDDDGDDDGDEPLGTLH